MEEESKRRRLPTKGGTEMMMRRLIKEDKTQPRIHFRPQGGARNTNTGDFAQRSDMREEGGGESEGGSGLEPSEMGEEQWEDIPTREGDTANGSEAKETTLSPRRNTNNTGRTKPSPRRNRRGFWLGRKKKLTGEASKKQNIN